MRRGLVISNCQIQPIKHMMSMYSDDIVFDGFGVHLLPHDNKDHINNLVSNIDKYDVVLTVPLSDQYEEISSEKIGNYVKSTKLVRIANMYFSGLHPDLTYIGGLSKRV
ncbi:WcbI family polysaccharide biosynthesis putative acetyltransferase, partial [Methylobacterium frigidaeris]